MVGGCCGSIEPDQPGSIENLAKLQIPVIMIMPAGDGLACLRITIIPGSSAVVHDNGCIEFAPAENWQPKDIAGYRRDEGDPFLFYPLWPQCEKRYHGTRHFPDGSLDVLMICDHPEHPSYKQYVSCETCDACSLRSHKA
jgi:hypothetical protein